MIQDNTKAKFHLYAMRLNFDNYIIIEDMFPVVWKKKWCKTTLQNIRKSNDWDCKTLFIR
jgi:hypothetical protein